jgi:hypothetical protein
LENLDAKLNRVKSECEAVKQAKDALENEYENYKVLETYILHTVDPPFSSHLPFLMEGTYEVIITSCFVGKSFPPVFCNTHKKRD